MDRLDSYREIIEKIVSEHASLPVAFGDIEREAIFDRQRDRYVLMVVGRQNGRRVHGSTIHVDIIDGKVWIQYDGTERGIARELLDAGIPKEHIVLGFKSPELRQYTDFATA
ncbi:hypothetical protein BH23PLA1_BH23PLA1_39180 [soil metagenome]